MNGGKGRPTADRVREFELRTGVDVRRNAPMFTPVALADRRDVQPYRAGSFLHEEPHVDSAPLSNVRPDRSAWCSRCKAGQHERCARRRKAVRGFAPCLCPKCRREPLSNEGDPKQK